MASRIKYIEPESVKLDPRRCFTPRQRREIYDRDKGACGVCGHYVRPGESWTAGHVIAHSIGGRTITNNGQIECHKNGCSAQTHSRDTSTAAKDKRLRCVTCINKRKIASRNNLSKAARAKMKDWIATKNADG